MFPTITHAVGMDILDNYFVSTAAHPPAASCNPEIPTASSSNALYASFAEPTNDLEFHCTMSSSRACASALISRSTQSSSSYTHPASNPIATKVELDGSSPSAKRSVLDSSNLWLEDVLHAASKIYNLSP